MADSERTVFFRPAASSGGPGRRLVALLEGRRVVRALVIGVLTAAAALGLGRAGLLERAELASGDQRARWAARGLGSSDLIEVVDYDEASVQQGGDLGRFGEWPRSVHADLLGFIARGKPRVVAFDLLFAESSGSAEDRDLAEACRKAGDAVLACSFSPARGPAAAGAYAELPAAEAERLSLGPAAGAPAGLAVMNGATWPYRELRGACRAVGSVHLEADPDDVTRRVSPAVVHAGRLWSTLSTAAAAAALEGEPRPVLADGALGLGPGRFPLDASGRRLIRWYGPNAGLPPGRAPRYRTTSAGLILQSVRDGRDRFSPVERFGGKVVLVGSSAAGSFDLRSTPFGYEPGVYIHAAAIESLLRGDAVRRIGGGPAALAAAGLALAAALAFAFGRGWRVALVGSALTAGLAGGYAAAAFGLYARQGLWLDLAVPETAAALSLGGSLLAGYLVEGRSARQLRRGLARFLSPEVLAEIGGQLDELRPGMGRRREITVMFCDARGFTPVAEKLSPEAAVEVLDAYLGAMSDCILAQGGTLSKYIGDGIMTFWNAPVAQADHAKLAARAALAMVRAQEDLKIRLASEGRPVFDVGVGLHSGAAVVGTVGSERRLDYTAIGDTVNLASRVEGLTKDFGVRIVATREFAALAGEEFEFRPLGSVTVKGRSAPVEVFELMGSKEDRP